MATAPTSPSPPEVVVIPFDDTSRIRKVTVYNKSDTAEVTREVHWVPKQAGLYELKLRGLPRSVDRDSVRLEGTGLCTILSCTYAEEHVDVDEGVSPVTDASAKLKELHTRLTGVLEAITALHAQDARRQAMEAYVRQYTTLVGGSGRSSSSGGDNKPANLETFDAVLSYSRKHLEESDSERASIERQERALEEERNELQKRINQLNYETSSSGAKTVLVRQVLVGLDVTEAAPIDLSVRYIARGARWSSSYDVRVSVANSTISCVYYGEVRQHTGEDWDGVALTLSTAEPAISGTPPSVSAKTVGWRRPPSPPLPQAAQFIQRLTAPMPMPMCSAACAPPQPPMPGLPGGGMFGGAPPPPPPAPVMTAAVDSGAGSLGAVAYPIKTPATVKSDNECKKLTVGVLALAAEVTHYVVPSQEAAAYLKAKATNSTDYLLLASGDVSIFFDNRFVTKTSLKMVSPGESFDIFLGVDPAVKVAFAPPRKISRKRGILTKTQQVTHTHTTTLNNAKSVAVTVAVVDVLPRSSEEPIKVVLKDPAPASVESVSVGESEEALVAAALESLEGEGGAAGGAAPGVGVLKVAQSTGGKTVWIVRLAPHGELHVPFEYTVEWPVGRDIQED